MPPLSLYIHMPWCIKKCPYCDFNSHELRGDLPETEYINAILYDLESALPNIWGRRIQSVFIGGGTPSLFSGSAINQLIEGVRARISLSPYSEITLEANPGAVDCQYIEEYKALGINRISLGIQSFDSRHLKTLGRIHNDTDAIKAIETVGKVFGNFNLDIIYGLSNQTIEEALCDIKTALSFKPKHISCYNLTIEPNTAYFNKPPENLPSNDLCYQMQDEIIAKLKDNNYQRYEISAFATNGYKSAHNLNYWCFGDYLGIGAGAHSKLTIQNKIIRQMRYKNPKEYLARAHKQSLIYEEIIIPPEELTLEFMMNALRLIDGFDLTLFHDRTGLNVNTILPKLLDAEAQNFVKLTRGRVIPTEHGLDFLNNLLELFM